MLCVIHAFPQYCYAECPYAECCYTECYSAVEFVISKVALETHHFF
jgi:hypothetical protein